MESGGVGMGISSVMEVPRRVHTGFWAGSGGLRGGLCPPLEQGFLRAGVWPRPL